MFILKFYNYKKINFNIMQQLFKMRIKKYKKISDILNNIF